MTHEPKFLLRGVAGSTAHGLAREGSDEDLHGVFAWPTEAFWGFESPKETLDGHDPQDFSYHEVEKFLRLALSNNPTILEVLYMEQYIEADPWGWLMVDNRNLFLHTDGVRQAYLGYAESQFRKLIQRGGKSFSSDTKNRTAKHARHLFRLLEQAESLLRTGTFSIRVKDPDWYFELESWSVGEWLDTYFSKAAALEEVVSVLPDAPDREYWNNFLIDYRRDH